MPETMDGLKLSHYIRDGWPPVKLIVTSGKTLVWRPDDRRPDRVSPFPRARDADHSLREIYVEGRDELAAVGSVD